VPRASTMLLLSSEINPLLMVLGPNGEPERSPEHADPAASRKGRLNGPILIIEDDAAIRDTLAEILEYEGFGVVATASGEEALQRLQEGLEPGLILLDLMMPGINGWGVAGQLRRLPALASVPVVVVSGVHDIEQQAASLGVQGCLDKPVEVERLLEIIQRFCH
jgi:two-component system chemotaxis response regulator CheY